MFQRESEAKEPADFEDPAEGADEVFVRRVEVQGRAVDGGEDGAVGEWPQHLQDSQHGEHATYLARVAYLTVSVGSSCRKGMDENELIPFQQDNVLI